MREENNNADHRNENDPRMIGKRALIGVTRVTPQGKVLRQMFGTIAAIDAQPASR